MFGSLGTFQEFTLAVKGLSVCVVKFFKFLCFNVMLLLFVSFAHHNYNYNYNYKCI